MGVYVSSREQTEFIEKLLNLMDAFRLIQNDLIVRAANKDRRR
jgi:hypothetical protein